MFDVIRALIQEHYKKKAIKCLKHLDDKSTLEVFSTAKYSIISKMSDMIIDECSGLIVHQAMNHVKEIYKEIDYKFLNEEPFNEELFQSRMLVIKLYMTKNLLTSYVAHKLNEKQTEFLYTPTKDNRIEKVKILKNKETANENS